MIKKIIALAAGALLSLNASAGYVQYELTGPVKGFFIQHDTDKSIAFYNINATAEYVSAHFFASGPFDTKLTGASTQYTGAGPTNFSAWTALSERYYEEIEIRFFNDGYGSYIYDALYSQVRHQSTPETFIAHPLTTSFSGRATLGTVSPDLASYIDAVGGWPDGIAHIVPTFIDVPEPGSLALLLIGALGVAGAVRRRKAAA